MTSLNRTPTKTPSLNLPIIWHIICQGWDQTLYEGDGCDQASTQCLGIYGAWMQYPQRSHKWCYISQLFHRLTRVLPTYSTDDLSVWLLPHSADAVQLPQLFSWKHIYMIPSHSSVNHCSLSLSLLCRHLKAEISHGDRGLYTFLCIISQSLY